EQRQPAFYFRRDEIIMHRPPIRDPGREVGTRLAGHSLVLYRLDRPDGGHKISRLRTEKPQDGYPVAFVEYAAAVAKLADAQDSGSCVARRGGSSPLSRIDPSECRG